MSLLTDLVGTALEPGYRQAAARPGRAGRRWMVVVALVLAGTLFGTAAFQTTQQAPEMAKERATLIDQINQAQSANLDLTHTLQQRQSEVDRLQAAQLGADSSVQTGVDRLGVLTGAVPVTGPGVVVVVDDAGGLSGTNDSQSIVVDTDLRRLVNSLWQVGAEAIAINGHRITSRTAIRGAGTAITVDYVSLNRPYRVEAIGDPKTMPARFNSTPGGGLWNLLKQNYGMRYDLSTSESLTLPADAGLGLRTAKAGR
ncbi:DUF881 domain-containing protein [Aestuariimicrobium kwangyangense]|uniref:DUF881 domain-containing protein n=1 Tax=Aestuariimicrobium kwangyangense TaxID=396389 RepID=UPI000418350F|nr:DUF881 domain-containing protein [Aestuariimicrobium kwangyangense]